jgi:SAM-dependent methyltransferase
VTTHSTYVPTTAPTPIPDDSLLPHLYAHDGANGWSQGMRAITGALLETLSLPPGALLEIGCGSGQMLAALKRRYPDRTITGMDLHPLALAHAQQSTGGQCALLQGNMLQLPAATESVAAIIALDALDQRAVDIVDALKECHRVLMDQGALVMRVSAHAWLEGAHDLAFNTGRRYSMEELLDALAAANLDLIRITYANSLLSLPMGALRLLQRWQILPFSEAIYTGGAINRILAQVLQAEAQFLRENDLPLGLSLYAIARKHL